MADTTALKNRIRAAIKANDNREITGPVLQQSLLDIVDELNLYPELEKIVDEELALGAVYDVSAKNPTAGPNNDGKWESLSVLLSDANLNTLIPMSVRKGGMSIKFINSDTNQYEQWRLIATSWSVNVSDWAICSN